MSHLHRHLLSVVSATVGHKDRAKVVLMLARRMASRDLRREPLDPGSLLLDRWSAQRGAAACGLKYEPSSAEAQLSSQQLSGTARFTSSCWTSCLSLTGQRRASADTRR